MEYGGLNLFSRSSEDVATRRAASFSGLHASYLWEPMVFIEIRHGSVREGTRCARHLSYQDPHEAHHNRDAVLNRNAARHVATNASPQQEAVLVHLGFYLLREGF